MLRSVATVLFLAVLVASAPGREVRSHPLPEAKGEDGHRLLSARDAAIYAEAFAAAKGREWKRAERIATRATDPLPAKVVRWLRLKAPESRASFEEIAEFLADNGDWPDEDALRRRAERAMTEGVADSLILSWFAARPPLTREGKIRYAEALLAAGDRREAVSRLRAAWIEGRFTRAEERSFLRRFKDHLRPDDHTLRLDRLLWDGAHDEARRMMPRVDRDHQALAEARLRLRAMSGGVDRAIGQVPNHLRAHPGLAYERLRWRRLKGRLDSALGLLRESPAELVRPAFWWRERLALVRQSLLAGYISEAYRFARDHGQPIGTEFSDAEWLAGWIAHRYLEDYGIARDHFRAVYREAATPVSRARGAYWAGRAADAVGDRADARQWYARAATYGTTFYGQLAGERLGAGGSLRLPVEPVPSALAVSRFDEREVAAVTRRLAELGEDRLVQTFVFRLHDLATSPEEHLLVASFALSLGSPDLAIAVATRARRAGIELPRHGYPLIDFPDTGGPERALLLSLSRQESSFNAKAISRAGARGVMQLLPATARRVAGWLNVRYSKSRLTSDPAYNVRLGSAYLSSLLNMFDGSTVLALAAYNAGPSRVRRWLLDYGDPRDPGVDVVDWIESIPFEETRNYVQRVLEGIAVYRERLRETEIARAGTSPP